MPLIGYGCFVDHVSIVERDSMDPTHILVSRVEALFRGEQGAHSK